ncbi:MAG TPA: hypothetical protein VMH26_18310 [Burkholderiales bacterium]|nr:hypothetical protein [Burkholderiales bacterium]
MTNKPLLPARFPDPPDPPKPVQTLTRWDSFIGEIASGTPVEDAMLKCYVKRKDIETVTRANPQELKRYREAKLSGLRAAYSEFDMDEFFNRIAMGSKVQDAYQEVFGKSVPHTFYQLLREDKDFEDRYETAQKTKGLLEVERILEIVDDKTDDTLPGPKGGTVPNMAAVARAREQWNARKWIAQVGNRRFYGDKQAETQVNVQVNLAEKLESARARAKNRGTVPMPRQVVDAAFREVPEVNLDEKPIDTTWLEEK